MDKRSGDGPQIIDLSAIIRSRVSKSTARLIPSFLLHRLERLIRQRELNEMLRVAWPAEGSQFSRRIIDHLGITVEVRGLEALPADRSYVFASNHPLGGMDGITLVAILGERYGDDNIAVLVNDMLMNVHPLRRVFLPINKYGRQGRRSAEIINEAYASGRQMVIFPAGLVSRLGDDGSIRDLEWHKAFVAKAIRYNREIVPVHFEALNRMRFYKAARWRKRLHIKVNLEQVLLPGELVNATGRKFRVTFGKPTDPAAMRADGLTDMQIAARIRDIVYKLP